MHTPVGLGRWLEEPTDALAVVPDEILCVGDTHCNDILPAVQAGCRTIWIHPFADVPHRGPEVRVAGLAEVAPLLQGGTGPARVQP